MLSAITLASNKIRVRIFEKEKQRSKFSKALVIHSGTLEILEVLHPQLLKILLTQGKKIHHLRFGSKYNIDLNLIPSKFNFALSLEQNETEKILEEYLQEFGIKVERLALLTDLKNEKDKVTVTIQKSNQILIIGADYLLDCSGTHSIIRKNILQLSFKGEKYLGKIVMEDVKIKSHLKNDEAFVTSSKSGIAGFVTLTEKNYFRVILIPHFKGEIPNKISINYFLNLTKILAPDIELSTENKWLTKFEISKRMVEKLQVGRIFLADDAAHIHSPVGGQGMNLGMQDAVNISLKLKRVLVDLEDKKILDLYQKQRMPVIKDILGNTDLAMHFGVEDSFISKIGIGILKNLVPPVFFHSRFLQKKLCTKVSQIKSARNEIEKMKKLISKRD